MALKSLSVWHLSETGSKKNSLFFRVVNRCSILSFQTLYFIFLLNNGPLIALWSRSPFKHIQKVVFSLSVVCVPLWCFALSRRFNVLSFSASQVSGVQMHESGSEPTSHTIPANQTENGNNSENESGLRGSQTPPAEAPRVSHFLLHCFTLHAQFLKAALPRNSVTCFSKNALSN